MALLVPNHSQAPTVKLLPAGYVLQAREKGTRLIDEDGLLSLIAATKEPKPPSPIPQARPLGPAPSQAAPAASQAPPAALSAISRAGAAGQQRAWERLWLFMLQPVLTTSAYALQCGFDPLFLLVLAFCHRCILCSRAQ